MWMFGIMIWCWGLTDFHGIRAFDDGFVIMSLPQTGMLEIFEITILFGITANLRISPRASARCHLTRLWALRMISTEQKHPRLLATKPLSNFNFTFLFLSAATPQSNQIDSWTFDDFPMSMSIEFGFLPATQYFPDQSRPHKSPAWMFRERMAWDFVAPFRKFVEPGPK